MNSAEPHWVFSFARAIAESPFSVAPERAQDLFAIRGEKDLVIGFVQELKGFHLSTTVDDGRISFGLGTLERLWAYAYGYYALVEAVQQEQPSGKALDLVGDPSLREAMDLVRWAHSREFDVSAEPWPEHIPTPDPSSAKGTLGFGANETFLMMAGWMILHEIGHVVLHHPIELGQPSAEAISQEKDADDWAFAWMLSQWKEYEGDDPAVFTKRTIGISIALTIFASFEVYNSKRGARTHPNPPERLYRFLDAWVPRHGDVGESSDFAWFVAIVVLKLHFDNQGVPMDPTKVYDSAPECVADMLVLLSTHGRESGGSAKDAE